MTAHSASMRLLGAVAALAVLTAGGASAQTIANPDKKIAPAAKPAAAPAKSGAATKTAAKPAAKLSDQTGTDYWAINTDLGKYKRDDKPAPAERTIASRQPLRDAAGTVGFTSGDIRNGTLSDGSSVPGLERYNQEQKSYVGMSLSVTSSDKGFPLLPRNSSW